jgi:hypothetical protein
MMELSQLSKHDLVTILKTVEAGASIEDALKEFVPSSIGDIINVLHSIYCKEKHTGLEGESYCGYYDETLWTDSDHAKWLALMNRVIKKCDCDMKVIEDVFSYLTRIESIKEDLLKKEGEKGLLLLNTLLQLPNIE